MEIYLPIAEQSMNVFVLLALGGAAGLLAGMFGVGGGFLATPLLIFVGIPPAVAVASQANQVVANSISSLQVQWRRGNVDLRMGLILLLGGMVGSSAGVTLFTYLKRIGQIDFVIAVLYVVMLSAIGGLMMYESLGTWLKRRRNPTAPRGKLHTHYLVHRLPWKMRFYKSKLYISAFLPIGLGFVIGVLSAILGVGGGFVLVPAMIYLLGMPTTVVIGTSNFQILFVAANVTFLQAATNGTAKDDAWKAAVTVGPNADAWTGTGVGQQSYSLAQLKSGIALKNEGGSPLYVEVSAQGYPVKPLPPASDRISVERAMFTTDGKKLIWASNRNGKIETETNLFIADWVK